MFTLTPEEFRLCLERSEYRPSDVKIHVIGLNDGSIQAVTCALIGQLDNCSSEITNGVSFHTGICDLNIETGEWIIHDKGMCVNSIETGEWIIHDKGMFITLLRLVNG